MTATVSDPIYRLDFVKIFTHVQYNFLGICISLQFCMIWELSQALVIIITTREIIITGFGVAAYNILNV